MKPAQKILFRINSNPKPIPLSAVRTGLRLVPDTNLTKKKTMAKSNKKLMTSISMPLIFNPRKDSSCVFIFDLLF
jgi:hypothetical protein